MREMKDSGIEWIGEIPTDWETRKIKQLADPNVENSFVDGDWIESPHIVDSGIRYLTTGNIGDGVFKEQGNGYITPKTFEELACKYAFPGDLIISRLNTPYGRSCILPSNYAEYVVAVDNVILRTQEDKRYICYVSQCDGYKQTVADEAKGTTMKRISRTNLGNIVIPLPPVHQQHRIADYLDRKCSQIDAIIARQQEVIEKLKAYKLSVITEAVTKGLNPNVPMKDSGVEWIGEIPEHWKIAKLKNYCHLKTGITPSTSNAEWFDGEVQWFTPGDFNESYQLAKSKRTLSINALESSVAVVAPVNTVMIIGIGATAGKVGFSVVECSFNQQITALLTNSVNPKFLMYWMIANSKFLRETALFTTLPILNNQTIGSYLLLCPENDTEEKQIADYLDEKCNELECTIAAKEKIISKLAEYKKALIYEVVTGKREV